MIRPVTPDDMTRLLSLWLVSTTEAHPFIEPRYWQESLPLVRDAYLPGAQSWLYESAGEMVGFISVLERNFIGALFIAPGQQGKGFGGALLNYVKQRYPELSLEVYQQNRRAVGFYRAQGFMVEASAWQEETRHSTWIMRWAAGQTP